MEDDRFDGNGAHVQYDDFVGTISFDEEGMSGGLVKALRTAGVLPDGYGVLGGEFFLHPSGGGLGGRLTVYAYAAADVPEDGNIADLVEDDGGLPVREFESEDPSILYLLLLNGLKRFKVEFVFGRVPKEGWHLKAESGD